MKNSNWKFRLITALFILGIIFAAFPAQTAQASAITPASASTTVEQFAASLSKGDASTPIGLFVSGVIAVPIVQQGGDATYVSTKSGTVTQFGMASSYGSIGLLAHNYLSGSSFSKIGSGKTISIVFGDGSIRNYQVSEIKKYQALSPTDPYSNFVNLSSGATITSTDLFNETYGKGGTVVLQTCIKKNGVSSWGRLFIIATPI